MNIFRIIIASLLVFTCSVMHVHAEDLGEEDAVESSSLKISLDEKTGTGVVYGRVCDHCDELKLTITPQTRAYRGYTQVALAEAKSRLGREATVIFNKQTKDVIRIQW